MIHFFVPGVPVTQGSTRAFVRGGRAVVTHVKHGPLLEWRNAIAFAAREAAGDVFYGKDTPVDVWAIFYLPRPKSAPKRVTIPTKRPDLDKLGRGVLDALTGVVMVDDAQVRGLTLEKAFGERLGVDITIEEAWA